MEIWKDSNLGRVKRVERGITRKDGVKTNEDDYEKVVLHKDKKKDFLLVADAFLENENNYKYVTH